MSKWSDINYRIFQKPTVKVGDRVKFTRYAVYRNIPSSRMKPGIRGRVVRLGDATTSVIVLWDGYRGTQSYHPSFITKARKCTND